MVKTFTLFKSSTPRRDYRHVMNYQGFRQHHSQKVPEHSYSVSKKDNPTLSGFTSAFVGHLAEVLFEMEMTKLGYTLSKPTLDSASRYDFVLDDGFRLYRIQIKSLRRRKNGNYELKLRATHKSSPDYVYTPNDTDYVVGVDINNGYLAWVKAEDIKGATSMTVGTWKDESLHNV